MVPVSFGRRHAGEDPCAVLRRGARDRDHQTRVVDQLSVVGQQRPVEAIAQDGRSQLHGAVGRDPARPGQCGRRCACQSAQPVSGHEAEPHQGAFCATHGRQKRHQLWHGVHEVRRVARHEDSALDRAAPRDPHVAGGEVAQPAVHQLGAPPAGAERQIVLLHQHHRKATRRGIERDTRPRDAAADDDDVDRVAVGQRGEFGGSTGGGQCGRSNHGLRYPFREWASSTASAEASRIDSTI